MAVKQGFEQELYCIDCDRDMTEAEWEKSYEAEFGYYWIAETTFAGHVRCEECIEDYADRNHP